MLGNLWSQSNITGCVTCYTCHSVTVSHHITTWLNWITSGHMQFWGKRFQEQVSGINFREPVPEFWGTVLEVWGSIPEISGNSFLVSCFSYFSYFSCFSGFWLLASGKLQITPKTKNLKPETRNQKNQKPEARNQKPEKPETRKLFPEISGIVPQNSGTVPQTSGTGSLKFIPKICSWNLLLKSVPEIFSWDLFLKPFSPELHVTWCDPI